MRGTVKDIPRRSLCLHDIIRNVLTKAAILMIGADVQKPRLCTACLVRHQRVQFPPLLAAELKHDALQRLSRLATGFADNDFSLYPFIGHEDFLNLPCLPHSKIYFIGNQIAVRRRCLTQGILSRRDCL